MANYKNFQELLFDEIRQGEKYPKQFLRNGKNPLDEAIRHNKGK